MITLLLLKGGYVIIIKINNNSIFTSRLNNAEKQSVKGGWNVVALVAGYQILNPTVFYYKLNENEIDKLTSLGYCIQEGQSEGSFSVRNEYKFLYPGQMWEILGNYENTFDYS